MGFFLEQRKVISNSKSNQRNCLLRLIQPICPTNCKTKTGIYYLQTDFLTSYFNNFFNFLINISTPYKLIRFEDATYTQIFKLTQATNSVLIKILT
jgi:hypothetical protein